MLRLLLVDPTLLAKPEPTWHGLGVANRQVQWQVFGSSMADDDCSQGVAGTTLQAGSKLEHVLLREACLGHCVHHLQDML